MERDHPGVTQELPRKLPPTGDKETQSHLSQKRYDRLALERERRVSRDHQGGARGIAADMALGFAAEGVHLAVCACTKADVEAKVKEIARATGAKVIGVPGGLDPQYLRRGKRKNRQGTALSPRKSPSPLVPVGSRWSVCSADFPS